MNSHLLSGLLLLATASAQGSHIAALHPATFDDARSVKQIGEVSANRDGSLLALEEDGRILVFRAQKTLKPIRTFSGTMPLWAPGGARLAFYEYADGNTRIAIWDVSTDKVKIAADLPGGISPDLMTPMGSARWFSWSPDSRKIAFVSRRMAGYEELGRLQPEAPVQVYTEQEISRTAPLAGVIHAADNWQWNTGDLAPERMRAVERQPTRRFNRLFIADVDTGICVEVNTGRSPFFPAWSPDGKKLAYVIDEPGTPPAELGWISLSSDLAILDLRSGAEVDMKPPLPILGPPAWSPDGSVVAALGQRRLVGFASLQLYAVGAHRWNTVETPGGKSVLTRVPLRWFRGSSQVVVKLADRFRDTLWTFNPNRNRFQQISTNELQVESFDVADDGRAYLTASGPEFAARLYEKPRLSDDRLDLIYDPNPQLRGIRFGDQRAFTWVNSAGDEVDGIAILPPDYEPGRRYPAIVDLYPRRVQNGFKLSPTAHYMGQLAAARGYVVLLAGIRAPIAAYAFSRDEEYTEKARGLPGIEIMIDDLRSGLRYLSNQGIVDEDRVCLFGHSNGGYVVNLVITETDVGRCAVVDAGFNNFLFPILGADPPQTRDDRTNGNLYENFDDYARLSPVFRLNRVHVPVLLISGDRDWDWTLQTLSEFSSLRMLHKRVTWVRYRDEGHYFNPASVDDAFERIMCFVGRELGSNASGARCDGALRADCCNQASASSAVTSP